MRTDLVLTVAQSKRLIAKGVAAYEPVRRALAEGTVAIARGGTNAYIVEELLGEAIEKRSYVAGQVVPRGVSRQQAGLSGALGEVVLVRGERKDGVLATEALAEMGPGDVFVKGANALNYGLGVAGVLIGHPTGGTVGAAIGTIVARRIRLLIPVGLEKEVGWDIADASRRLAEEEGPGPSLWPLEGDIFTELEALESLSGVVAVPIGAGGVAGAEGATWLACFGSRERVERVAALGEELASEPPFTVVA